jgi:putative oxidoreductase
MQTLADKYYSFTGAVCNTVKHLDGLPPLLFRVLLFFPFWEAGTRKFANFENTSAWFASMDFPLPDLMTFLAASTETVGAVLLLTGFAVRWAVIPLMITMLVAIFAVHWDNGWFAIAQSTDPEISERLARARTILQDHGNYSWLTAKGNIVVLQNGIEFAATYFIVLLSLFFTGSGRYVSADYWLSKAFPHKK